MNFFSNAWNLWAKSSVQICGRFISYFCHWKFFYIFVSVTLRKLSFFLFYINVNSKLREVYFINQSQIFLYLVVSVKSRKLSLFLFLETLIKNCGRFIFYICQYSFYGFVVSVRLRKLSIISDFITATVGLKTFLFI